MDLFRRTLRTLPLLLVFALAASACSSGAPASSDATAGDPPEAVRPDRPDEPLARVLAASDQALEAESMHMVFDFAMRVAGEEITGSGEADAAFGDELRQHMTFRYDSMLGMPEGFGMEMIVDGSTMYMRLDGMDELAVFPTEWVSLDMSASVPGFDDLTAFGNGQSDPSNAFGYLQGAEDARELGTETIDGVETTHYEVSVDIADAVAEVPADLRDEMRRALKQFRTAFGTTTMPFEVWVDGDGLVRRVVYEMGSDGGTMGPFSMAITMNITEYGNDFELRVPSPGDVTDLTELAGMARANR
jgi:hypothetical protein